jgi:hypothetical protein
VACLTTEGSPSDFMVRTGDHLETTVRLPSETGAWPAIWTWLDGGNEVDVFEYHPDNPDLLELTNHVRGTHRYVRRQAVHPGAVLQLGVTFGRHNVIWTVNGEPVFADGRGVGRHWKAYLIVNLSVCAGRYHPAPAPETTEITYDVHRLVITRPHGTHSTAENTETHRIGEEDPHT